MLLLALFLLGANNLYDIVIEHGHIVDGTGSPWYSGDIGIRQGRIAAIGNLSGAAAKRTIDARGMVVAPGFIDMLGQSEMTILVNPHLPSKIYQGITTEITGEGLIDRAADGRVAQEPIEWDMNITASMPDWRTFREYFARLEKQGMGINLASYVGATQVRRVVLGDDDRAPNAAELERMQGAGARGDARWGGRGIDFAAIRSRAIRHYGRTDRAGSGSREIRRDLCNPHAQRRGRHHSGAGRGDPHRARGAYSGGDLASESRRESQLGAHAGSDCAYPAGARCGGGY